MQTLLTCKDITAIRASLNRMKSEYKVKRYGTPDKCTSPADAFWVVYDNAGVVIAILGPGQGKRIEYRSMQYSKLENYNAMGSLWFTFAK